MDCRVFIGHGLSTSGEIYYGEPPVAEDNRIVTEDTLAVRAPVGHAREHSAERLLLDVAKMVLVVDAYDSAHCFTPCEIFLIALCPLPEQCHGHVLSNL